MSTTETVEPETYTDMELFFLHDLEFEVPCDGQPGITECDKTPKWEGLFSCGCTRLWCDEHLKAAQAFSEAGEMYCCTCQLATGSYSSVTILFIQPKSPGH